MFKPFKPLRTPNYNTILLIINLTFQIIITILLIINPIFLIINKTFPTKLHNLLFKVPFLIRKWLIWRRILTIWSSHKLLSCRNKDSSWTTTRKSYLG